MGILTTIKNWWLNVTGGNEGIAPEDQKPLPGKWVKVKVGEKWENTTEIIRITNKNTGKNLKIPKKAPVTGNKGIQIGTRWYKPETIDIEFKRVKVDITEDKWVYDTFDSSTWVGR